MSIRVKGGEYRYSTHFLDLNGSLHGIKEQKKSAIRLSLLECLFSR